MTARRAQAAPRAGAWAMVHGLRLRAGAGTVAWSARLRIAAFVLAALLIAGCEEEFVELPGAYLALGDSVGVGIGAERPASSGYVALIHERLPAAQHAPPLANLAVPGATTTSMIERGQLRDAIALIEGGIDGAPVSLVTLSIGGNDAARLFEPCAGGPSPQCEAAAVEVLDAFAGNFDRILGELREAAGADTRIAVMTYYNPLVQPGCRFHEHAALADDVLEGGGALGLEAGLNDLIRDIAAAHDVLVAEIAGEHEPERLRSDCLHLNDTGYEVLAERFMEALRDAE